jgi:hypothetical protein
MLHITASPGGRPNLTIVGMPDAVFLLLAAAAAVVAVLAWRGRRSGGTPVCRRCGFDLAGLPPATEHRACPECGRNTADPKAVAFGHRRRRPLLAATALLVLLAAIAGWTLTQPNLRGRALAATPDRFVVALADAGMPAALGEATRRLDHGALTEPATARLADAALDRHADRATTFDPDWAALLDGLAANDTLSDHHWRRYAQQAYAGGITLKAAPVVERNEHLPLRCTTTASRVGAIPTHHRPTISERLVDIRINGRSVSEGGFSHSGGLFNGRHSVDWTVNTDGLDVGEHEIAITILHWIDPAGSAPSPGWDEEPEGAWKQHASTTFRIAELGDAPIPLARGPEARRAVERSIVAEPFEIPKAERDDAWSLIRYTLRTTDATGPRIAADIFIEAPAIGRVKIGRFVSMDLPSGMSDALRDTPDNRRRLGVLPWDDAWPETLTLVLEPTPEAVTSRGVESRPLFAERIIFHNVPVRRVDPDAASSPAPDQSVAPTPGPHPATPPTDEPQP